MININNFLDKDLKFLDGVGEKTAERLYVLLNGGTRVRQLLYHFPVDFIDRSFNPKISDLIAGTEEVGKIATFKVEILQHKPGFKGSPYKVICSDGTGRISLPFFNVKFMEWVKDKLPAGQVRVISGKIDKFRGEITMSHPDYILEERYFDSIRCMETIYPLTAGISNKFLKALIWKVLKILEGLPEWNDKNLMEREEWKSWLEAMKLMHLSKERSCLVPEFPARKRLAYDEILASQLALGILHRNERQLQGMTTLGDGRYVKKLLASLPFELTGAQKRSVDDVFSDMAQPKRMLRLLQGDVGSGKTIVAVLALLNAVETGGQALLMAPTDLLVRQHYQDVFNMLNKAGLLDEIGIDLISGKDKPIDKKYKLMKLSSGATKIAIGTHSLFQEAVEFKNLVLAVIDEQHRFGVGQRLNLVAKSKGEHPADVLAMSATPIPRTLTMTIYGDMDLSIIDELPPGRQLIHTTSVSLDRLEELVISLQKKIREDEKVYWVCPLIEESETLNFTAVETRFRYLSEFFGEKVAFIHGKTDKTERDIIMADFKNPNGVVKILVSTTVIEVGVNVPDATIMVIENSERFGLSQLHQLRGRVGRGSKKSTCILLYGEKITDIARQRILAMKASQDGFILAEEDLKLRGSGEILGTKQSGFPTFKVADYANDKELFYIAKDDVKVILANDPALKTPRGEALKVLLQLFDKEDVFSFIMGG